MSLPYHLRVRSTPAIPRGQARRALALTTLAVAEPRVLVRAASTVRARPLERCVERNTVRYSEPANSALGQYFDLEAACRSAIEGDAETGFTLTPEASGPEGAAAETPGPPSRAPAAPGGASGEDAPGGANGQDGAPAAPVRRARRTRVPRGRPRGVRDDASASPPRRVGRARRPAPGGERPPRSGGRRAGPWPGVPYWVIAIVAFGDRGSRSRSRYGTAARGTDRVPGTAEPAPRPAAVPCRRAPETSSPWRPSRCSARARALAFRSGGYFLADWGLVAIVILSGVALVGLLAGGLGGWVGVASVGSWIGLAAFQSVSADWADDPGAAQDAANLTLALRRRARAGHDGASTRVLAHQSGRHHADRGRRGVRDRRRRASRTRGRR